jgi:hypothetical protein
LLFTDYNSFLTMLLVCMLSGNCWIAAFCASLGNWPFLISSVAIHHLKLKHRRVEEEGNVSPVAGAQPEGER